MTVHPMPPGLPSPRTVSTAQYKLRLARQHLADAAESTHSNIRYSRAHVAALHAAAAVLAARETAAPARRGRPRTAWERLAAAEPVLAEWAVFFASGADKRAAAEAGLPTATTPAEADTLLHDANLFVTLVEDILGIPTQQSLPLTG
ncbi:SAV_6107 family HEPN domain-containing protein [Actinocorallia libanotica]|uniref:SAV-6107-like HEPN domain-containing protein n=1 Tax=Actinocorallia libanotica TaxID=46162 RepID=A0ABN1RAW5_9ACTN